MLRRMIRLGGARALSSGGKRMTAIDFLQKERGLPAPVAREVLDTLKMAGAGGSDEEMIKSLQSMGQGGLQTLVATIERDFEEVEAKKPGPTVSVRVHVLRDDRTFILDGKQGESLFDIVQRRDNELADHLECACEGKMMCSTCHVYLDEGTYARLGPPTEAEEDMLDLAFEYDESRSRLGCQVVLQEDMQGTQITIPRGVNNYFR